MPKREPTIWTVGHSTRPIEEFLELLAAAGIELLADVRRFPASRRHPQFNREALIQALAETRIGYEHFPGLGGRRNNRLPDSPNRAWRVQAFNAYADHVQSGEFQADFDRLIELAETRRTAIMCAEALPQQCHRRIIADVLAAHGWTVKHLLTPKRIEDHRLTEFARVEGHAVTYPQATLF